MYYMSTREVTNWSQTQVSIRQKSQIGWIFKSKADVSYCLYESGPMVRNCLKNTPQLAQTGLNPSEMTQKAPRIGPDRPKTLGYDPKTL